MQKILKTIERIAILVGLGLTFYAVIEILQAYESLARMHPYAGYGFLVLCGILIIGLIWQVRALFRYPSAPQLPEIPETKPIPQSDIKKFVKYLQLICKRMAKNEILINHAPGSLRDLEIRVDKLGQLSKNEPEFRREILCIEQESFEPLVEILDKKAESIVSDNVGLVTIGTALSPYRSIDLYIVIARNFKMVNQIIRIYRTSPTIRESIAVFYDIVRVVAAVNILNATDQLWTGTIRHFPLAHTWGEAISEGLFSGLLTSVAGHAAIDRCRTYRSWSREEAVKTYLGRIKRWAKDVEDIFNRHMLERMKFWKKKDGDAGSPEDFFDSSSEDNPRTQMFNFWKFFGKRDAG
ncbi:MAG: DUF697 domain-containing protein [Calditrichaeota bacterium]|nr:DUF697 domain-containing protein [Calditrichota bacterium]